MEKKPILLNFVKWNKYRKFKNPKIYSFNEMSYLSYF